MKNFTILVLLCLLTACQSTFYIVRHAEKATQPKENPPLTEAGQQRAEDLKMLLANKKISRIYSTNTIRTFSTAKPISSARGVMIEYYSTKKVVNGTMTNQNVQSDSLQIFIEELKKIKGKNVLIVGHSNTTKFVVNGLYEHDTLKNDLADNEFDKLFIVKRKFSPRKTSFEMKSYGKASL